ncbi:MAG: hypothetical protein ACRDQH_15205 [Pseudonocardiaceae bacterium]
MLFAISASIAGFLMFTWSKRRRRDGRSWSYAVWVIQRSTLPTSRHGRYTRYARLLIPLQGRAGLWSGSISWDDPGR